MDEQISPIIGTSVGDSAVDKRGDVLKPIETEKIETPVETKIELVVVPGVGEPPHIDGLRCATCREIKQDHQLMKQPLDYKLNSDGSVSSYTTRYSLFCGICQKFLGIYDPVAQKELKEMIDSRNVIEKKKI